MMKTKLFLTVCLLVFFAIVASGQKLQVIVYKGQLSFDGKNNLELKVLHTIPKNIGYLKHSANTSALIIDLTNKTFKVIESNVESMVYDYSKKFFPMTSRLLSYMNYMHENEVTSKATKGGVVGGHKAINDKNETAATTKENVIFPNNDAVVLSNEVRLQWELLEDVFGGRLIVTDSATNQILYDEKAGRKGEKTITINKEGTYSWSVYSKMEDKKFIDRDFTIPTKEKGKKILDDLAEFKKQNATLSSDMQELLVEDYIEKNNIVIN